MPWEMKNQMNQRSEFVLKAMKTDNFRELCREYQISPRVGYKWKARFEREGLEGMGERSRRPQQSPEGLTEEVVCRIVCFKQRHPYWGARKIQVLYQRQWGQGPSESSSKRVLKKAGLVKTRKVRAASAGGRIHTGRKATAPNEVWTVDFKGWWRDADGRCEPLTVRDECSRFVLANRALENAKTEGVRAVFEELFARYGLPAAIRSDNGSPFAASSALLGLSRLSAWWVALGIALERGRPACPQDNGGHERLHHDIAREIEGTAYQGRQATLDVWTKEFNEERPHEALGMKTPAEVYQKSPRPWQGTPEELAYEGLAQRRVQSTGAIRYAGHSYFLSGSLAGWNVGLKAVRAGKLEVYFASLLLGHLEPASVSFCGIKSHGETPHEDEAATPTHASDWAAGSTPGQAAPADAGATCPSVTPAAQSGVSPSTPLPPVDDQTTTMKH